jgi:NADPH:quinone reductase-like Zn-dependent oxidoreductase
MLAGNYLYAPKMPLVPGYEVAGVVDALGSGVTGFALGQRVAALTVYGGFGQMPLREAEHFVPIPDGVSDVWKQLRSILNYVTAWQMIHRIAKVQPGQTALVTGAAGGVGTALLQLLHLAGARTYGAASLMKHGMVGKLGATPIDYRSGGMDRLTRVLEPQGRGLRFRWVGGANIGLSIEAARRGGTVVGYGFMAVRGTTATLNCYRGKFPALDTFTPFARPVGIAAIGILVTPFLRLPQRTVLHLWLRLA